MHVQYLLFALLCTRLNLNLSKITEAEKICYDECKGNGGRRKREKIYNMQKYFECKQNEIDTSMKTRQD